MSGGAYGFICHQTIADMFNGDTLDSLRNLSELIGAFDGSQQAVDDTLQLIVDVLTVRDTLAKKMKALSGVWRAAEWYASGDAGLEDVHQALRKYNKKHEGRYE